MIALIVRIILIALAAYTALFTLWRTFDREHVEDIPKAIDRLLLAAALSIYLARLPSLVELLLRHAISPLLILNPLVGTPAWQVAVILFCIILYQLCRKDWRDTYALLDFCVVSVAFFLAGASLWQLVSSIVSLVTEGGTVPIGYLITIAVGMVYFFVTSRLLAYFERQYRAYFWYRYRRSSAQTGFVTSVFLISAGIFGLLGNIYQLPFPFLSQSMFLTIFSLFTLVGGFILLYIRSGRLRKR